jgi:PAS domain S-box-containing protein
LNIVPKIIVIVLSTVLPVMGVVAVTANLQTEKSGIAQVQRVANAELHVARHDVQNTKDVIEKTAEVIAHNRSITRALDTGLSRGVNQILNDLVEIYPFLNYVLIAEADGQVFAVSTKDRNGKKIASEQLLDENIIRSPMYPEMDEETLSISSPTDDPFLLQLGINHGKTQWYMTEIVRRGIKIGHIVLSYDWFREQSKALKHTTEFLVADGSPAIATILTDINDEIVAGVWPENHDWQSHPNYLVASSDVMFGSAAMKLTVINDRNAALKSVAEAQNRLLLTMVFGAVVLLGIIYLALRRLLVSKIKLLHEGTAALRAGHLDFQLPDLGVDELGKLCAAFNEMAKSLMDTTVSRDDAQKVAEELEFQKSALDAHAIVNIIAADGTIIYANDKFCAVTGFSREELVGHNHHLTRSNDHSNEFYEELWGIISNGDIWHGEIRNKTRDGGHYWVNATIVPFLNENGEPFQYVGIQTDITVEKQREIDLREAINAAEAANVAKSNFLSTMSHEIRTPLNGVLGLAQLLTDTKLNIDQKRKVDTILSSGQTLLAIINDVLDISRIEAGGVELEEKAFILRNVVSMIATPFQSLADEKGIVLSVIDKVDSNAAIKGDPIRLRQVLWNLLSNAIKFTETGNVTLAIAEVTGDGVKLSDTRDRVVRFYVEDSGTGIAADRLEEIFDPFTQEDSSITRKHGGTGLGLSIVKQLTEMMGGTVTVESKQGKGTKFDICVPFYNATKDEADSLLLQSETPELYHSESMKILVAEDNLVNAMIAKAFLEKFGHEVRHVENGIEAVDVAKENWADLILMDIHMPEMNGIDATKLIRITEPGKDLPIIGLTAEAFAERHAQFIEAGMDDILTKPFTEHQLSETLAVYGRAIDREKTEANTQSNEEDQSYDIANSDGKIPIGDIEGLESLRNQLGSNTVQKLLLSAEATLNERMDELRGGVAAENSDQVRQAAHSIKGACGSLFAPRICDLVADIEEQSFDISKIRQQMPELEKIAQDTVTWWRDKLS